MCVKKKDKNQLKKDDYELIHKHLNDEELENLVNEGLSIKEIVRLIKSGHSKADLRNAAKFNKETYEGTVKLNFITDLLTTILAFFK